MNAWTHRREGGHSSLDFLTLTTFVPIKGKLIGQPISLASLIVQVRSAQSNWRGAALFFITEDHAINREANEGEQRGFLTCYISSRALMLFCIAQCAPSKDIG